MSEKLVDGLVFLSMWRMPAPRQPRFPSGATWMDISSAGRALPRAKVQILLRPLELSSSDVFSYYENADGRVSAFSSCIIRIKVVRQPSKLDERGQYPHGALTQCSKKVVIVQVGENFMVFVSGGCFEQPNRLWSDHHWLLPRESFVIGSCFVGELPGVSY